MNTLRVATIRALLLSLFSASLSLAAAPPDRDDDVSTTVLSLERSRFAAQQDKDTVALNALLDEALMWVDPNGALLTKAAYLSALHDDGQTTRKIAPASMTVKVFATVAVVVGIYDETGLKNGHVTHLRCRFIDTWAWKKGKWVCIAATAMPATS